MRGNAQSYELCAIRQHEYLNNTMAALEYYKFSYLLENEFTITFLKKAYNPNEAPDYWDTRKIIRLRKYIEKFESLEQEEIICLDNVLDAYMYNDIRTIIKEYLAKHKTLKCIIQEVIRRVYVGRDGVALRELALL
jgi:hypothetical protein